MKSSFVPPSLTTSVSSSSVEVTNNISVLARARMPRPAFFAAAAAVAASATSSAAPPPPPRLLSATYSSGMVLQHDAPCLWGYAQPSSPVSLTLLPGPGNPSPSSPTASGTAGPDSRWRACFSGLVPSTASWSLNVTAAQPVAPNASTVLLADVLLGEVWIGGGQSNFAFTLDQAFNASAECADAANYPTLRIFTVAQLESNVTLDDLDPATGIWQPWASVADPGVACRPGFDFYSNSAVGFFFGRALVRKLGIPVGIVSSTVPGTAIELWMSPEAFAACNASAASASDAERAAERAARVRHADELLSMPASVLASQPVWRLPRSLALRDGTDGYLYNGMIAPLLGVSIRGAIFFQGESNVGMPSYSCRFPALITDWRAKWEATSSTSPNFPFLFVQLAPYYPNAPPTCLAGGNPITDPGELPLQRITQTLALALPATGMASAVDIGDAASPFWPGSVHPRNKLVVGERLALEARRIVYGEAGLVTRGPQLAALEVVPDDMDHEGSYHSKDATTFRLHFESTGDGIMLTAQAQVAFVATYNDSTRVPGTMLPTNLTSTSVDVYLTPAFSAIVPFPVSLDALWFDFPVVPLVNTPGLLPLEPFIVPVNASAVECARSGAWRRTGCSRIAWEAARTSK